MKAQRQRLVGQPQRRLVAEEVAVGERRLPARHDVVAIDLRFAVLLAHRDHHPEDRPRAVVPLAGVRAAGRVDRERITGPRKPLEKLARVELVELRLAHQRQLLGGDRELVGQRAQPLGRVEEVGDCRIVLSDGESLPADLTIWVTAASPPALLESIDLPKAEDGFLAVEDTLQSTAGVPVFAVGDSATLVKNPVLKAGVYAVREGRPPVHADVPGLPSDAGDAFRFFTGAGDAL